MTAAGLRVGTDIVRIGEIPRSLCRFGGRFLAHVFTDRAAAYCADFAGPAHTAALAGRLAAKEAVMKLLGTNELTFTEIETTRSPHGVGVLLHGAAARRASRAGIAGLAVSLSHEDEYAVATAVGHARHVEEMERMSEENPVPCQVPLLDATAEFPRIQAMLDHETECFGRPRNLTRAMANSPAGWQLTTRALQLYSTLRVIDRGTVDLLCLYVSLLNGCAYCVDDAAGEALSTGWTPPELLALADGPDADWPPHTACALRYARQLTRRPSVEDPALLLRLREHYGAEGLIELAAIIGMKNFWNRFATSLRIPPEGKCADRELARELTTISVALGSTS